MKVSIIALGTNVAIRTLTVSRSLVDALECQAGTDGLNTWELSCMDRQ